jgi:hypothetical protein
MPFELADQLPATLAQIRRWEPGFGDPTPLGWAVTVLYFVVAALAWRAHRAARGLGDGAASRGELARFWLVVAIVVLALGLNKQLDFQRLATQIARDGAKEGGWYRDRRPVQIAAVVAVATIGLGALAFAWFRLRSVLREVWPALLGLALVGAYIAARVTSLHAIDVLLTIGPAKLRWILEPLGLALIGFAARRRPRNPSTDNRTPFIGTGA